MLKNTEIFCEKYNQSLEIKYQNDDKYVCSLKLSPNGKQIHVFNYKPQGYKEVEQNINNGNDDDRIELEF